MNEPRCGSSCGLSPPTRGIRLTAAARLRLIGSIPAYAGDPRESCASCRAAKVYPRLRGGSVSGILPERADEGSIPAYAGDPIAAAARWWLPEVYPRLRGGSGVGGKPIESVDGLSPPTRGIRVRRRGGGRRRGSIPAYAGDP